jgi:hypothetical protein
VGFQAIHVGLGDGEFRLPVMVGVNVCHILFPAQEFR